MARAKPTEVDRFGRVLIPKDLRDRVGLTSGREVRIVVEGEGLLLTPQRESVMLKKKGGVLVITGEAVGDIRSAVARDRARRLRGLAGKGR